MMNSSIRYRFDELTLDIGRRQLLRGTETIALSKLSFRLLGALVEAAPNLVTHEELAVKVWGPRRIVAPENLAKRVMILRRALGDRADAPRYVAGVRGEGYRLLPEVRVDAKSSTGTVGELERGVASGQSVRNIVAGLVLVTVAFIAAGAYLLKQPDNRTEPQASIADLPLERPSHGEASTVRINVELVDADTDSLIWSDTYEGELTIEDIRGVQGEIAKSIAEGLNVAPAAGDIAHVGPGYSVFL